MVVKETRELIWQDKAECKNYPPAIFYPEDSVGVDAARQICMMCEVQADCLEYALENKELFGVWGGTSERERRRILKQRRSSGV